jgi:hypothetical protein
VSDCPGREDRYHWWETSGPLSVHCPDCGASGTIVVDESEVPEVAARERQG